MNFVQVFSKLLIFLRPYFNVFTVCVTHFEYTIAIIYFSVFIFAFFHILCAIFLSYATFFPVQLCRNNAMPDANFYFSSTINWCFNIVYVIFSFFSNIHFRCFPPILFLCEQHCLAFDLTIFQIQRLDMTGLRAT